MSAAPQPNQPAGLDQLKENLRILSGDAKKDGVHCVRCREAFSDANTRTPAGWRETKISGYCENCWDTIMAVSDEDYDDD